jgi:hypothetical protein
MLRVKVKVRFAIGQASKVQMESNTLSSTSALGWVCGQRYVSAVLPPWNSSIKYPFYRRMGGSHGRSGHVRKISLPPWFDPRNFQPEASRYTDWAIPDPTMLRVALCKYKASNENISAILYLPQLNLATN